MNCWNSLTRLVSVSHVLIFLPLLRKGSFKKFRNLPFIFFSFTWFDVTYFSPTVFDFPLTLFVVSEDSPGVPFRKNKKYLSVKDSLFQSLSKYDEASETCPQSRPGCPTYNRMPPCSSSTCRWGSCTEIRGRLEDPGALNCLNRNFPYQRLSVTTVIVPSRVRMRSASSKKAIVKRCLPYESAHTTQDVYIVYVRERTWEGEMEWQTRLERLAVKGVEDRRVGTDC